MLRRHGDYLNITLENDHILREKTNEYCDSFCRKSFFQIIPILLFCEKVQFCHSNATKNALRRYIREKAEMAKFYALENLSIDLCCAM